MIDHQILNDSGLSPLQYILMDYLSSHDGEPIDENKLWKEKGILYDAGISAMLSKLEDKGFVTGDASECKVTDKWKQFFNTNDDFEKFWTLFEKTGNKKDAAEMYRRARKVQSAEFLTEKATAYIQNAKACGRYLLYASTWLNPQHEHWNDELPVPPAPKQKAPEPGVVKGKIFDD